MLAMNLFVVPVAFGGVMHFPAAGADPDTFVLTLPMAEKQEALALLVFIGGLSAATGMVIVETIALSTMVCNDLVMPVLLRMRSMRLDERQNLTGLLLGIRRGAIVAVVLLGYFYFRLAGEAYALVAIGLISFAAVAQFAPAVIGGIYWKGATRAGALAGLGRGIRRLALHAAAAVVRQVGMAADRLPRTTGRSASRCSSPTRCSGSTGLNDITHAMLWSMVANVGAYVVVSVFTRQSVAEQAQAARFVDVFRRGGEGPDVHVWKGTASLPDLQALLARFLGPERATAAMAATTRGAGATASPAAMPADAGLVQFAETELAGAIGGASARIMVASTVKEDALSIDEVRTMLDEASQVIAYSHELEQKSRELMAATAELRAANERLQELDRLKDDFVSTVTHELRTPLTSIRAFSEILHDNPGPRCRRAAEVPQHHHPGERAPDPSHQPGAGPRQAGVGPRRMAGLADRPQDGHRGLDQCDEPALPRARTSRSRRAFRAGVPPVRADRDRLVQVLINLLSNAVKFVERRRGPRRRRARPATPTPCASR